MRPLTLQLNAKLQPFDRGEYYEDPINDALEAAGFGCTDGGGTLLQNTGEIEYCDVEITLNDTSEAAYLKLIEILGSIGVPKGSLLREGEKETAIGTLEGLALYLNGTDLPDAVYESCDVNHIIAELNRQLGDHGRYLSYWQGPRETALYFYGTSFDQMKQLISNFIGEYPLCEKSRVVRIA